MSNCPSKYVLIEYYTGDSAAKDKAQIEDHLHNCQRCQQEIAALEKNVRQYEEKLDIHWSRVREQLALTREDHSPKMSWRSWKWIPALAVPAIVVVGLVFHLRYTPPPEKPTLQGSLQQSFKGQVAVEVVAKRGNRQFLLQPYAELQEGDALRFILTTSTPIYVSIFSLDADGKTSTFYPEADPEHIAMPYLLKRPGKHVLPDSIILDNTVGEELLIILFSERTFRRDLLHHRVAQLFKEGGLRSLTTQMVGVETQVLSIKKVKSGLP